MNRLQKVLQRHIKGQTVLVLFGMLIAFAFLLNVSNIPFGLRALTAHSDGLMILDLRIGYTPDEAYELLKALGPEGRRLYSIMHLVADVLFPLVYGSLFFTCIAWLMQRAAPPHHLAQRLAFVGIVAPIGDLAENACILAMNLAFPQRLDLLARIANLSTMLKGVGMLASIGIIAICLLALAWQRNTRASNVWPASSSAPKRRSSTKS